MHALHDPHCPYQLPRRGGMHLEVTLSSHLPHEITAHLPQACAPWAPVPVVRQQVRVHGHAHSGEATLWPDNLP